MARNTRYGTFVAKLGENTTQLPFNKHLQRAQKHFLTCINHTSKSRHPFSKHNSPPHNFHKRNKFQTIPTDIPSTHPRPSTHRISRQNITTTLFYIFTQLALQLQHIHSNSWIIPIWTNTTNSDVLSHQLPIPTSFLAKLALEHQLSIL